jgi:hypothetical protein
MSLARKLEVCVQQYLVNAGWEKPIFLGFGSEQAKRPHVLLYAVNSEEAIIGTGTRRVPLEITLKTDGDRTESNTHHSLFEELRDYLVTDSLIDDLNAVYPSDDFTVHAYQEMEHEDTFEEPRTWTSKMVLTMVCSPSAMVT